jgi:hypothetical protein
MALQQPLLMYPFNETVDATSSSLTFWLKIRGSQCIKYTIYLYDVATFTQQYSNTVTLGATLYDGDKLEITVNMATYGANTYVWKADLYYDSTHYTTTDYYPFTASTPSTFVFSPVVPTTVTSPSKEFLCAYVQIENVEIKYWEMRLYNSTTTQAQITAGTATYLQTSGETWSQNIRHTFNGLLNGYSYQIQCTGITQGGVAFATALSALQ